jgi:hypothetical protein
MSTRTVQRIGIPSVQPATGDPGHAWLRRVLALDLSATLGRAAWRPQALCIAVREHAPSAAIVGPRAWPTLDQLAGELGWAPGLVRRRLELATAAGLLALYDEIAIPPGPESPQPVASRPDEEPAGVQ